MDSGWAVVIGAVVAFAGTVLGPFLLEARKRRSDIEIACRDELSELIPRIFMSYRSPFEGDVPREETEMLTRLQLLVDKDAWPVAMIVTLVGTPQYRLSQYMGAAIDIVGAWFRGSIPPSDVLDLFHAKTGLNITDKPWEAPSE